MGKARNKNRTLSKSDKVYAKKARNKLKKQNQQKTGMKDVLKKLSQKSTKKGITGLMATESRRSFRKRLAKFKAERVQERKSGGSKTQSGEGEAKAESGATKAGPRNATYLALSKEHAALDRRIEAGVPTNIKQFNAMLNMCAAIGEYHLAVYILGQMSAQDLDPEDEAFDALQLLLTKTPTNESYMKNLDITAALGGLHPKVVIRQLVQKRAVEQKWVDLQPEVAKIKTWLLENCDKCNESGRCPNRFKLASFVASSCEVSNRQAREAVAGLCKSGFISQQKVKKSAGKDGENGKGSTVKVWVLKGQKVKQPASVSVTRGKRKHKATTNASSDADTNGDAEAEADTSAAGGSNGNENNDDDSSKKKRKKKGKKAKVKKAKASE